jgi:hypothetical protein
LNGRQRAAAKAPWSRETQDCRCQHKRRRNQHQQNHHQVYPRKPPLSAQREAYRQRVAAKNSLFRTFHSV